MTDRLLARCWWLLTMSMIAGAGLAALLIAYRGLFAAFAGAYTEGATCLAACLPLSIAVILLARHRLDLVCD